MELYFQVQPETRLRFVQQNNLDEKQDNVVYRDGADMQNWCLFPRQRQTWTRAPSFSIILTLQKSHLWADPWVARTFPDTSIAGCQEEVKLAKTCFWSTNKRKATGDCPGKKS